jgi:bifunctional DNA-binding transcriptional regulator/antitoxin component of YhaV-PrlF toxin-antitoxin module
MKPTTMTLTKKRQTVFPLEWCKRHGLEQGGPVNVFDLGGGNLLVRAVQPPSRELVEKLLSNKPPGRDTGREAMKIVNEVLRQVREEK